MIMFIVAWGATVFGGGNAAGSNGLKPAGSDVDALTTRSLFPPGTMVLHQRR